MTKLPPNEFINTNIGTIGNNNSWNNIPSSKVKEFIPEGKSIQELNEIRANLREYYKRNSVWILNGSGTGAGSGTLYTIPDGYIFYIDSIQMSGQGTGGGVSNFNVSLSQYGSLQIGQIRTGLAQAAVFSHSFNNPIPCRAGSLITWAVGANIAAYNVIITGWLEEINISNT